jgi:hypothetical protein
MLSILPVQSVTASGHQRFFKRKSRTSAFVPRYPTYRRVAPPGCLSSPKDEARRIAANIAKLP